MNVFMKKLLSFLYLSMMSLSVNAIPAMSGQWKLLTLKNGATVNAELKGDESCHYWVSEDGAYYIETDSLGFYEVANPFWIQKMADKGRKERTLPRRATTRAVIGGNHEPYIGTKKGLIILVDFQNKKFRDEHTHALYEDILNKVGFSNNLGFKGSVKDYFLSQSYGQFELDFDVIGPLTMPKTYGYYGANTQNKDTNPGLMIATACEMADEFVNFKDYDWDGDGEVDQVFVLYAGLGEAAGGDVNTIWPHEWRLEGSDYGKTLTLDGVVINTYACGSELIQTGRSESSIMISGIGTICHEFSHCLGLPDMYDTGGGNYAMANWDIMSSGSYNGNSFSPAAFTSYERMYCGWRQPIVLEKDVMVTNMKAIDEGGDFYIIYNDAAPQEYYLLENRQQTGWDEGLAGSGLLVLHIDFDVELWMYNLVNNTTDFDGYNKHQRCTVIPADNNFGNTDVATDVYPYGGKDSLTNNSLPRAELYNLNPDGIHYTSKPITKIKMEDGIISFEFQNKVKQNAETAITATSAVSPKSKPYIYDLHGRNLGTDASSLRKGIYIVGGKLVVR